MRFNSTNEPMKDQQMKNKAAGAPYEPLMATSINLYQCDPVRISNTERKLSPKVLKFGRASQNSSRPPNSCMPKTVKTKTKTNRTPQKFRIALKLSMVVSIKRRMFLFLVMRRVVRITRNRRNARATAKLLLRYASSIRPAVTTVASNKL